MHGVGVTQMQDCRMREEALQNHVREVDRHYATVLEQLRIVHGKWQAAEHKNLWLQQELDALRRVSGPFLSLVATMLAFSRVFFFSLLVFL